MLLNFLALLATAGIAYMGAARGLYRSGMTLASCVLAGTIALALMGPLAGLGPADARGGVWYYAGDAFVLWAVFCVAFLLIRGGADALTPTEAGFSPWVDRIGGGLAGALTGYLAAGLCVMLVQMLPTSPELLGYEAFKFIKREDIIKNHPAGPAPRGDAAMRGQPLLLGWDRGTLAFFNFISGGALGSDSGAILRRYGDVYPPPEMHEAGYRPVLDADDFLYYHWYRRHEYAGSGAAGSPLPAAVRSSSDGRGLVLKANEMMRAAGFELRVRGVYRLDFLNAFPDERPPADSDFLLVTVRFQPAGPVPAKIDSTQFYLLQSMGNRAGGPPMILGGARPSEQGRFEPDVPDTAAATTARDLRFGTVETNEGPASFYLMSGASFEFADPSQLEMRGLVFALPRATRTDNVRLMVDPKQPAAVPAKAAPVPTTSASTKAAPAATSAAAPAAKPAPTAPKAP